MNILLKFVLDSHNRNQQQSMQGFTLIELLIVIIIIGILGAISVPAMLSQAAKARQAEAKSFIGAINRAQQAYMVETLKFADSIDRLNILGNDNQSQYYSYSFVATATQGSVIATPFNINAGKIYTGAATLYINQAVLKTIICEAPQLDSTDKNLPEWDATGTTLYCPEPMVHIFH